MTGSATREHAESVGELSLGQAVEMRNQPVQFSAQAGAFNRVGDAIDPLSLWERVGVRGQANFRQIVKFGRGASEPGGAGDDGGKGGIS